MTSTCPFCGQPVRLGAAFCPNCGRTLPTTQSLLTTPLSAGVELHNRYVVSRRLGGGGAGDVYLATDKQLFNRQVVIKRLKIIDSDPKDRIEAERNFLREAEALAGLNNPHFPQILDFFIDGPSQYLVMEFVAGEDLSKIIEKANKPLPEPEVIYYGIQITELLVYLHDRDEPIIHRDIKPANIIVNSAKQATLVDFGIARSKAKSGGPNAVDPRDSAAWGTPGYAPPEQVAGQTVPRSDIFALGATLHHLITNRDPRDFVGEPFPPARRLNAMASQELSDLLARMLSPDARNRPDADETLIAFQQLAVSARVALATDTLPPTGSLPPNPPQPQRQQQAPRRTTPSPSGMNTVLALGGVAVTSVPIMVALADRNWEEARRKLYSGEIVRWLRNNGETQLAAQAEATTISTPDNDMGLETFLRRADPMLAQPRLEIEPIFINAGNLSGNNKKREQWRVRNSGRGALVARVRGQASWVRVTSPNVITVRAGQTITGSVEISRPTVPGRQVSSILADAGPAGQASIEVQASADIAAPGQGGLPGIVRVILALILLAIIALAFWAVFNGFTLTSLVSATATPGLIASVTPRITTPTAPVSSVPLAPNAASWAMVGYGASRSYFNPNQIGFPASIAWSIAIPDSTEEIAQLAITPNRMYVRSNAIRSVDLVSHTILWTSNAFDALGGMAVTQDLVLSPANGQMLVLKASDGAIAWAPQFEDTASGAPMVVENRVFQAEGNVLRGYDLTDGTDSGVFFAEAGAILSRPAWISGGPASTDLGGTIYRWDSDGNVVLSAPVVDGNGDTVSFLSPVSVMSNTMFLTASVGDERSALALAADGTTLWETPLPESIATAPALAEGVAFFSSSSSVLAIDTGSGEIVWEADLSDVTSSRGANLIDEPPSIAGSLLYVSTSNGVVVALNRNDGSEAGRLIVTRGGQALLHHPIPASSLLFVVGADDTVYALRGQ